MKSRKIVADSSCDLFALSHAPLATAPMKIITAEREFVDDEALDVGEMTDFLYRYKGTSKSSCPNTADWLAAFGEADEIFCVTITSGLSGSYNSACAAGKSYEQSHACRRVHVFNTLTAGPELTLIVERIEDCIAQDMTFDEICTHVDAYMKKTGLVFLLKSLRNFANNGRVSPIVAKLVGIAGICIIGKASDEGTLAPMHKCRGERASLEMLMKSLEAEGYVSGKISIGHCQNEAGADQLRALILSRFPDAQIEIHPFRGLCGFYAEKGGILVGFEKS